jgi:chromosome partitioning protein
MQVTVVANPKGGVGKSTLATNVAGYFARRGESVMLGDVDRQQSARDWLALRPAGLPTIAGWEVDRDAPARPPRGTTQAVLDTPAGLHGKLLAKTLRVATRVLIPLQPSLFDILATRHFLDALVEERVFRKGQLAVGVVAMRFDARTRSAAELDRFLAEAEVPVVAHIRNTQLYVQLAARGLTLFDVNPNPVAADLEQWEPLIRWLDA